MLEYVNFLKQHLKLTRPLKVVCDPSNGASGLIIRELINAQIPNLEIILINEKIDDDFPAHGPNPLAPGATDDASNTVVKYGADLGVIFDADGDRAFFVDNSGMALPSYIIASLLYKHLPPPFVADELVYQSLKHMNIFPEGTVFPSKIGTYFVKHELRQRNGSAAAEFSGHYYFRDFFFSDSGIFTMIQVLNVVSSLNTKLSDYWVTLPPSAMANEDVPLSDRTWLDIEITIDTLYTPKRIHIERRDGLTLDFGNKWINIRASNTEPLIRLVAGAENVEDAQALIQEIKQLV